MNPPVILTDTVICDRTVMVHDPDAPVAEAAVLRTHRLHAAAGVAQTVQTSFQMLHRFDKHFGADRQYLRLGQIVCTGRRVGL